MYVTNADFDHQRKIDELVKEGYQMGEAAQALNVRLTNDL